MYSQDIIVAVSLHHLSLLGCKSLFLLSLSLSLPLSFSPLSLSLLLSSLSLLLSSLCFILFSPFFFYRERDLSPSPPPPPIPDRQRNGLPPPSMPPPPPVTIASVSSRNYTIIGNFKIAFPQWRVIKCKYPGQFVFMSVCHFFHFCFIGLFSFLTLHSPFPSLSLSLSLSQSLVRLIFFLAIKYL